MLNEVFVGFPPIANCQLLIVYSRSPLPAEWRFPLLWLCVAVAAAISVVLTGALVRIAPARGWVVFPRQNRWSRRVVAQFGGIPILLAFWSGALLLTPARPYAILLLCTGALGLMGLIDDRRGLGPKPKLAVELLLAGLMVYAGVVYPLSPSLIANQILTVIWIAGITNAFNLIDNMDGLAAGAAVIALGTITLIEGVHSPLGVLALLLLISMGGFLLFNLHPARVFMGDVGSLPTGFFLACASVMAAAKLPGRGAAVLAPGLLLVVPVFDVLLVSVTRPLNGRAISDGARDHTSHRLVLLGLSESGAVRLLHGIALIAGLLAICQAKSASGWAAGGVALFVVALALMWSALTRMELPESWLSRHPGRVLRIPAALNRLASGISRFMLDAALIALAIYFSFLVFSATAMSVRLAILLVVVLAAILLLWARSMAGFLNRLLSESRWLPFVDGPTSKPDVAGIQAASEASNLYSPFVRDEVADEAELEAGRGRR